ncbi:MAG: hypothetical protein KDD21_11680 [Bacteroidetes bacterium]|nr:hypothetical protein [Bacteroidota bacterium]
MKLNKLIYLLIFIPLVISCKKEYHFNVNQITETDINGTLIGNVNINDWKLHKFSDATDFDKTIFNKFEQSQSNFRFSNFNANCTLPDTFSLLAYPNPIIGSDCSLFFKMNTSSNFYIQYGIVILTDKFGNIIRTSGSPNSSIWEEKTNVLTKRDFIYYDIFVTTDSCLFYTKGNVIGCEF